jgi:phosphinothricin acetyltransferase
VADPVDSLVVTADLIRIRLAHDEDADAITAIYRPVVESSTISFETVAPDRDEIARRMHETLRAYPWLVCDVDGRVAGYAYATRHRVRSAYQWSVDTSVYVDEAYRRRGIGHGLYESLFAILAAQGYFNAYAGIALPNPASVRLHESVGFEMIGVYRRVGYKLGCWCDVGWWQRSLQAHREAPHDPLQLCEVLARPDWETLMTRGVSMIRLDAA